MAAHIDFEELEKKIRSDDFEAQREACMALARDGRNTRALDLVLEARQSGNSQVRYYAKRAVETLCRRLELDPSEFEAQPREDSEALCKDLLSALNSGDPLSVSVSVKQLSNPAYKNSRREAVKLLSDYIIDGESRPLFGLSLKILVKFAGSQSLSQILPLLSSGSARIRADSVEALSLIQDDSAAEPIRGLLDDPDPRTRANAALALHRFDPEESKRVIDAMLSSTSPSLRSSGLWALSRIPSLGSDVVLVDFFSREEDQTLFVKSLKLLAKLPPSRIRDLASDLKGGAEGNPEKIRYVEVLLRKKLDVLGAASASVDGVGPEEEEISSTGDDPNSAECIEVSAKLHPAGSEHSGESDGLTGDEEVSAQGDSYRSEGLFRGVLFSDEAEEELFSLADIDPEIGRGRSRDHFDELIDKLTRQLKDPDKARRDSAAKYFAGIRSEEAIPALEKALKDPDNVVRAHARRALSAIAERDRPGLFEKIKSSKTAKWVAGITTGAILLILAYHLSSPDAGDEPLTQAAAQAGGVSALRAGMDANGKRIADKGKVTRIFASAGKLILNSGGRPVELSVLPDTMALVTEGDEVDFEATVTGILPSGVVSARCDLLKPSSGR